MASKTCIDVRVVMVQGGAWLQSDMFGWVGQDSLTDRHKSVGTEDGGGIGGTLQWGLSGVVSRPLRLDQDSGGSTQ